MRNKYIKLFVGIMFIIFVMSICLVDVTWKAYVPLCLSGGIIFGFLYVNGYTY